MKLGQIKLVLILLITCHPLVYVMAQRLEVSRDVKKAEAAFYNENFKEALRRYNAILRDDPGDNNAVYKAEICSLMTDWPSKSMERILSYTSTMGKRDKFYYYWLGRIFANQYQFEQAIQSWKAFLAVKSFKSKEIVDETKEYIGWAKRVMDFYNNPVDFEIELLHSMINTEHDEMSPVYFEDKNELLFVSSRSIGVVGETQFPFHIYHARHDENRWTPPELILQLGDFSSRSANIEVVNNDGKLFIFRDEFGGDLFYSELGNNGWSDPTEFDHGITNAEISSHFFISEQEDKIIFASDRKSINGSLDLFIANKMDNGVWTKAQALSSAINTPYDEDSPYISPDGKFLYFSSRGHDAIGGFDIFKASFDPALNHFGDPENMGFPINSIQDELFFKFNKNQKNGFFSSNRVHGEGGYDVYHFWKISMAEVEGILVDGSTNEVVPFATMKFHPSKYHDETFTAFTDQNGKYKVKLITDETFKVEVLVNNEVIFEDVFEVHTGKGYDIAVHKDFSVDHEKLNEALYGSDYGAETFIASASAATDLGGSEYTDVELLGSKFRRGNKAYLNNIYFETASSVLKGESRETLEALYRTLSDNRKIRVEISGHTDNQGSSDYNMQLSQDRAQAVVNFLTQKGIRGNRLVARGYGETKPLASNDDENEGRELNRRIEVEILE